METGTVHYNIEGRRVRTSSEQNLEWIWGGNSTMSNGRSVGGVNQVRGHEGGEDLWPEPEIVEIAGRDADGDIREK